jgi:hypothetical protein
MDWFYCILLPSMRTSSAYANVFCKSTADLHLHAKTTSFGSVSPWQGSSLELMVSTDSSQSPPPIFRIIQAAILFFSVSFNFSQKRCDDFTPIRSCIMQIFCWSDYARFELDDIMQDTCSSYYSLRRSDDALFARTHRNLTRHKEDKIEFSSCRPK